MLKHSNAFKMRTARKNPWALPLTFFVIGLVAFVAYAVRPAVSHARATLESYGQR